LSAGGFVPVAFATTPILSGLLGFSLPFFTTSGITSSVNAAQAELSSAGPVSTFFLMVSAVSAAGAVHPVSPSWLTHSATPMVH